jgi:hypothetical protein
MASVAAQIMPKVFIRFGRVAITTRDMARYILSTCCAPTTRLGQITVKRVMQISCHRIASGLLYHAISA